MVVKPSALNVIIIGLSMIVFSAGWRMFAGWVSQRNPNLGGAMSLVA